MDRAATRASRKLHAPDSIGNTLKDLFRHSTALLVSASFLALPAFAAAGVNSAGIGGKLFSGRGPGFTALGVALMALSVVATSIWAPIAFYGATRSIARGEKLSIEAVLGVIKNSALALRFLGVRLILGALYLASILLASLLPIGFFMFALAGSEGDLGSAFSAPFLGLALLVLVMTFTAGIALFLLVSVVYGLAPVINVLEEKSPFESMARSQSMTRGHRLDFFLLLLMRWFLLQLLGLLLLGPIYVITFSRLSGPLFLMGGVRGGAVGAVEALLIAVSTLLYTLMTLPIVAGTVSNFYLALRSEEVVKVVESKELPAPPDGLPT